ncbi:MAG: ABC transporter ATP-binding protein [Eubacteriales bacterium]|nr:ABC transporter ATP-binding protein [Eubacteriales bacterium]
MSVPLIETKHLKKYFPHKLGFVHAVDDVSLTINAGETLGVVGESGCGKSTLGRAILRLHEPTDGDVLFNGQSILGISGKEFRNYQMNMQMIFQDPYSSLNPRMSVNQLIADPLKVCKTVRGGAAIEEKVRATMELCGLPERYNDSYPHEMDGGRRQRVGLARALVLDPKFIVCDEPVSALDVSIQAQILNLLMDLQERNNLSYMFVTHDLCVVRHISNDIMVMYMGQVVEYAPKYEIFEHPAHPYTKALLSAIPTVDLASRNRETQVLKGEVSNPINPAPGCRFAPRCPYATQKCKEPQNLVEVGPKHFVACHECN